MRKTRRILLIFSIILAFLTTFLAQKVFVSIIEKNNNVQQELIQVPVAARDIPAMTKLSENDIKYIPLPKEFSGQISFILQTDLILNRTILYGVKQNSPFLPSHLIEDKMKKPFQIEDEYRVITIPRTALNTMGGHLTEGMFVDILWFHQTGDTVRTSVAFQNVKVLAIGSPNVAEVGSNGEHETISLRLSLRDAQRYYHMENTGQIRIILRPSQTVPIHSVPDYP